MKVYVLDASALIRYIDDEPGAARVEEILIECVSERAAVWISAVQWGEVAGNLRRRAGEAEQRRILSSLLPSQAEVVAATAERAVRAAALKVERKIAYADAFALELAMEAADRVLVTADYGFKAVEDVARIEFLRMK